ncbi:GTP cyclohydrolase II-domain-containing protein [Pseudoneurospora amorphoporcata]|uniref:GTP cyclohydrolase II n=1 Tax=Pseudoneurospora amorphoporcata TaxID=241081 RepID=A0AAN6NTG9_9PEZI|nr:GTP cyclohydrolase II-domain-containing protein [Pseudoneurospora amorphoporcata]
MCPAPTSDAHSHVDNTTTSQLPSFYSPKRKSQQDHTSRDNGDVESVVDLSSASLSSSTTSAQPTTTPAVTLDTSDNLSTNSSVPSTPLSQPPPPSLLSPSFTPPQTPGTATPSTSITSLSLSLSEPRGIPVDSSIPTGGCGSKKPKLLDSLPHVECIVRARIPTTNGAEMFLHLYTNDVDNKEHLAIVFGNNIRSQSLDRVREGETEMDRLVRGAYTGRLYPGRTTSREPGSVQTTAEKEAEEEEKKKKQTPLVRIHSECYTGETVWSARCDCGEQLDEAARLMSLPSNTAGGIIIYLRQEGRGIGLGEKLKAYNLQDLGSDTVEANLLLRHPADARSYGLATAMLRDLGQKEIRLLTNNPDKIRAVEGPNREIVVTERVAMVPLSWKGKGGFRAPEVEGYLKTKIEKMGHMLDMGALPQ